MVVERTDKEIIIRLSASIDTEDLQDILNYARYRELTDGFKVAQKDVDKLASQINKDWWVKNKKQLAR